MKTTLNQPRHGLILMMVMVVLALLATLVMSFLLMVSQTRIPTDPETGGSGGQAASVDRKEALMQLLRGAGGSSKTPLNKSVIGPHSILENLYGQPVDVTGDYLRFNVADKASWTFTPNGITIDVTTIPLTDLFDGSLINALSLMGTVITIPDDSIPPAPDKFKNRSMRIVNVKVDGSGDVNMEIVPPSGMPLTELSALSAALANCDLIINGAPFSGTGIGFGPAGPNGERLTLTDGDGLESFLRPNPLAPIDPANVSAVATTGILSSRANFSGVTLTAAEQLQEYVASLQYGFTSANPDYTAADQNSMFLARQDVNANGQVTRIIPSFHRPNELKTTWLNSLSPAQQTWETLRKLVLRPLPYDNPQFTGGTPELGLAALADAAACATIFATEPMVAGAAYDVDSDGDGVAESYWMDIGLGPVTFDGDPEIYKPLVAYLVLDLDGRIDINAHSFVASAPTASTGSGRGPAEITAVYSPPNSRSITERYGTNGVADISDALLANTAYGTPAYALYSGYVPLGSVWATIKSTPIRTSTNALFRGSVPDLWGNRLSADFAPTGSALDKLGQRDFDGVNTLTYEEALFKSIDALTSVVTYTNPYLYNPNPADNNWTIGTTPSAAFKLPQFASLLSSRDIDGTRMPPELRKILFGTDGRYPNTADGSNEQYLRNWLTGITADIPSPPMSIGDDISIYDRIWRIIGPASPATAADEARFWAIYNALPDDIRAGRKVDLNTAVTMSTDQKARFAQSLFVLLCVLCDTEIQAYTTGSDFDSSMTTDAAKQAYTYKRLAQWCVNLVDFSDADEVMTPFVIPATPTRANLFQTSVAWLGKPLDYSIAFDAAANVAKYNYTEKLLTGDTTLTGHLPLWGLERPSVLITETLAFHDKKTGTGSAFVELYNASNPTAPGTKPVDLAQQDTTNTDYIWRLAVTNALNSTTGEWSGTDFEKWKGTGSKDQEEPFRTTDTNTTIDPELDSVVWFGTLPTTGYAKTVEDKSYFPAAAAAASIDSNEYFVVGPRPVTSTKTATPPASVPANCDDSAVIDFAYLVDTSRAKPPKTMTATKSSVGFNIGDGGAVSNDRIPFHKVVLLQRLADSTRAHNVTSNPYVTVDWCPFDLTVYDSSTSPTPTIQPELASRQWGRAPATVKDTNLWSRQLDSGDFIESGKASAFPPELKKWDWINASDFATVTCTLGYLNSYPTLTDGPQDDDDTTITLPAVGDPTYADAYAKKYRYRGRPQTGTPFAYLHWNDAPFSSSLEALQVPASSPGRFGLEFDPGAVNTIYVAANGSLGWNATKTTHILNFFHSTTTGNPSLNLGKFFDYVSLPSLFAGTVDANGNRLYREPGKVNLNTMNEKTYEALMGSRPTMESFSSVANLRDTSRQPFRAVDASNRVAPTIPPTTLPAPITASTLRSEGSGEPLFANDTGNASNTQQSLESLQRLSELTTTRSNTFAVWVTIGLFEVVGYDDPATPVVENLPFPTAAAANAAQGTSYPDDDYFNAVHPDGYFLGPERGSNGNVPKKRFRNLYIIDRTIPVGFRRGEDYNVEETVIYGLEELKNGRSLQ
ncbi:MAG: hypothetical protein ACRC46_08360 [Thermoguttaceae bacterium]